MPPEIKDFADLIRWLADTRHGGSVNQIAKALRVSSATVDKWVHRVTRNPSLSFIYLLCETYRLDIREVLPLIAKPRRRSTAARIVLAVAVLTGLATAPAFASPLSAGPERPDTEHYVKKFRRRPRHLAPCDARPLPLVA